MPTDPHANLAGLACPLTKQALTPVAIEDADRAAAGRIEPCLRTGFATRAFGRTPTVLLRADNSGAFPVVDGVPILLGPELLAPPTPPGGGQTFDLKAPQYAEAYEEMEHYNKVAEGMALEVGKPGSMWFISDALRRAPDQRPKFPEPPTDWVEAPYDSYSEWIAYKHMAPIAGTTMAQVGGTGTHAVKLLVGGAARTCLVSPMLGEIKYAQAIAREMGVLDRFRGVVGVGEELPFPAASLDRIYCGGCVHHMDTTKAMPEFHRVLTPGGKFAAVEPWKAPIYSLGIKLLGKREPTVFCKPMTHERIAPMYAAFPKSRVEHAGAIFRYPAIAAWKFGFKPRTSSLFKLWRVDAAIMRALPPLKTWGGSIAMLGER